VIDGDPDGSEAAPQDKRRCRQQLLAARSARPPADRARLAAGIQAVGLALVRERGARRVTGYAPLADEPDVQPLLDALLADGVSVLLPLVRPGHRLGWAEYTGAAALRTGSFGILEPAGPELAPAIDDVDLAFVPALAVDCSGHRLGRGGGYFDRLLAAGPGFPAFAVVYDEEVVERLPVETHDQRVAGAVTPSRLVLAGTG
jgi:5-formyltetrahydrofolate cyclo-ligase